MLARFAHVCSEKLVNRFVAPREYYQCLGGGTTRGMGRNGGDPFLYRKPIPESVRGGAQFSLGRAHGLIEALDFLQGPNIIHSQT